MNRNREGPSRRGPRRSARRRRHEPTADQHPGLAAGGSNNRGKIRTRSKVMLLACAVTIVTVSLSYGCIFLLGGEKEKPPPPSTDTPKRPRPAVNGESLFINENSTSDDRTRWKREAGWGSVADDDLEEWAPLGPDPLGCLPRAPPQSQPAVMVGWGFGSTRLTLYAYRALESLLHVYPKARVKFITIGPRYAFYYKWANIIARTQFQKYQKRGYDVKVEIYFGGAVMNVRQNGKDIPGSKWWKRHANDVLYGNGMAMGKFQSVHDALPSASSTLFLALLELYKNGGIYVDLTTFFVRPLPPDLDGFVVGGMGTGGFDEEMSDEGGAKDCSLATASEKRQRALVMQYSAPRHPVVACALAAYDKQTSSLNECVSESRGKGDGGLHCVLETLEACTEQAHTKNFLREAGVVDWSGCDESVTMSYSEPVSYPRRDTADALDPGAITGPGAVASAAATELQALTALPPAQRTPPSQMYSNSSAWPAASMVSEGAKDAGLLSRSEDDEASGSMSSSSGSRINESAGGEGGEGRGRDDDDSDAAVAGEGQDDGEGDDEGDGAGVSEKEEGGDKEQEVERVEEDEGKEPGEEGVVEDEGALAAIRASESELEPSVDAEKVEKVEVGEERGDTGAGDDEGALAPIRASESELEVNEDVEAGDLRVVGGEGASASGRGSSPQEEQEQELDGNVTEEMKGGDGDTELGSREAAEEEALTAIRASASEPEEKEQEQELSIDVTGDETVDVEEAGGSEGKMNMEGQEQRSERRTRRLDWADERNDSDVVELEEDARSYPRKIRGRKEDANTMRKEFRGGVSEGGRGKRPRQEFWLPGMEEGVEEVEIAAEQAREGDEGRLSPGSSRRRGLMLVEEEGEGDMESSKWEREAPHAEQVSLMWLGPEVSNGKWMAPAEGSVWQELFSRLRLTRWRPQQVSASCRRPCGHWDTLSSGGKRPSDQAKAQAQFQCAPSVFVPGTQKGASTFLFHAISFHPQVVQPLRGAHGFKETGRYAPRVAMGPQKLGLRLAAFPFIEEYENFVTGDGTVTYMSQDMRTPEAIKADNTHAKIVFALRDPVARAWSDFRFLWDTYSHESSGFEGVARSSLDIMKKCFEGHDGDDPEPLVWTGTGSGELIVSDKDKEGMRRFFSSCSITGDPGQIVRKGIYYYQVLHWVSVFGSENIMVVDSADLKSNQKETIQQVYKFLGLCPVDMSEFAPENVTLDPKIPERKKINAKAYKMLQDFYAPYNKKLYKLLGRDLGWEKNTFKAGRR